MSGKRRVLKKQSAAGLTKREVYSSDDESSQAKASTASSQDALYVPRALQDFAKKTEYGGTTKFVPMEIGHVH